MYKDLKNIHWLSINVIGWKNVASRAFEMFFFSPCDLVIGPWWPVYKGKQDIFKANILIECYDKKMINVTSKHVHKDYCLFLDLSLSYVTLDNAYMKDASEQTF